MTKLQWTELAVKIYELAETCIKDCLDGRQGLIEEQVKAIAPLAIASATDEDDDFADLASSVSRDCLHSMLEGAINALWLALYEGPEDF